MNEETNISNISGDTGIGNRVVLGKEEILSRKYFLKGKTIGISISESDNLHELGYGIVHLRDAVIEIARYILASGGRLAYGGDMRQGGFTELIFDLLAYYKADKELLPYERFFSYLTYPISTTLTSEKEAELKQNVSFIKVKLPEDLIIENPEVFLKPDSASNLYIWTRCLTNMREEMELTSDARIFVGGRAKGFKGKYPGVLEELLIALKHKHPVYLIGAFGGITKDASDAINGKEPDSLTDDYHLNTPEYKDLFSLYNQKHSENKLDYSKSLSILQALGPKGLSDLNGLTEAENLRLARTPHLGEIIQLILKGLTNSFTH